MKIKALLLALLSTFLLAACAAPADEAEAPEEEPEAEEAEESADEAEEMEEEASEDISGSITVLTNRTDLVDTTFVEYAAQFNEIYPDVEVEFEALRDYPGEVQIRLNTQDYGDVLLVPNTVGPDELGNFFEPLGTVEELEQKYRRVTEDSFEGTVYGIPVTVNAQGVLYNKAVWEAAGVEELPETPEEFIEALALIDENTDAIPLYTNYAAGWPLTDQWEDNITSIAVDADYRNTQLAQIDDIFAEDTPHNTLYGVLYSATAEGLIEDDPTTTDWELSKQLMADGEVATMILGSWSIVQVQALAENPDDIAYMPFPTNADGTRYSTVAGDWKLGINVNSENKEAARAWVDWFLDESNFAFDQGGIPPLVDQDLPSQYDAFTELGVEFISPNPPPAGEEAILADIDSEAEIGIITSDPGFRQRIIDAARGATDESWEDITADLNARWAEARAEVLSE